MASLASAPPLRIERDHGGRREEHFLPGGPFAILPLKGKRSSIVWTDATAEADRIVALPDDRIHASSSGVRLHLGEITASARRLAFPLGFRFAPPSWPSVSRSVG